MPRSRQAYFADIVTRIVEASNQLPGDNQIDSFSEGPPPDPEYALFFHGMATLQWEIAYQAFASKLANLARWSGRTLTDDDVPDLAETFPNDVNPDNFDVREYNRHVNRSDLDAWAEGQGVSRIPARPATGSVLVTLPDRSTSVPAGTVFQAGDGADTPGLEYVTVTDRSPEPGESVIRDVRVRAVTPGRIGNTAVGTITEEPSFVQAVINREPISGGETEETQDELRARGRRSLELNAGGEIEQAVVGALIREYRSNGLELNDVTTIDHQYPDQESSEENVFGLDYQYTEVVVDGGASDEALGGLGTPESDGFLDDWAYPAPFRLNRPTRHPLNISATLVPDKRATPADVDPQRAENYVLRWLAEDFALGDEFDTAELTYQMFSSDPEDIGGIDGLEVIDTLTGESVPPGTDLDAQISKRDKIVAGDVTITVHGAGGG